MTMVVEKSTESSRGGMRNGHREEEGWSREGGRGWLYLIGREQYQWLVQSQGDPLRDRGRCQRSLGGSGSRSHGMMT